jgi:two-component system, OmpR family, torCAD operon response regulator TorR
VKYRVLIVDDEALLARMLSNAFAEEGFESVTAASAEDAATVINTQDPFDLLLLDIRLPGKSGIELLQELGDLPATRIVLMTAYDTDETYQQSIVLGADLYLKKPFDLKVVLNKAMELLEKGARA